MFFQTFVMLKFSPIFEEARKCWNELAAPDIKDTYRISEKIKNVVAAYLVYIIISETVLHDNMEMFSFELHTSLKNTFSSGLKWQFSALNLNTYKQVCSRLY